MQLILSCYSQIIFFSFHDIFSSFLDDRFLAIVYVSLGAERKKDRNGEYEYSERVKELAREAYGDNLSKNIVFSTHDLSNDILRCRGRNH